MCGVTLVEEFAAEKLDVAELRCRLLCGEDVVDALEERDTHAAWDVDIDTCFECLLLGLGSSLLVDRGYGVQVLNGDIEGGAREVIGVYQDCTARVHLIPSRDNIELLVYI